jgi:hypothetical protein
MNPDDDHDLPPAPCVSGYFPELDAERFPMPRPLGADITYREPAGLKLRPRREELLRVVDAKGG